MLKPIPDSRVGALLVTVESNRAADILRQLDREAREGILGAMPLESANVVRTLLSWPEDCVAAHMATDALALSSTTTAGQAVDHIRDRASRRSFDVLVGAQVYVTGPNEELLGAVPLRAWCWHRPTAR